MSQSSVPARWAVCSPRGWREQGARVTLVDVDRERLSIIGRDGITLADDKGSRTVPVGAALAADVATPVDLLLLFTKGIHSAAAIRSVAHLAEARPIALTLQNGIGNADLLAAGFGAGQVLMGTAHVPADLTGPASVVTHGFGHLDLGGFTAAGHDLAPAVAALLRKAGFDTHVASDINAAVWEKVAFNAALNAVAMICQVPNAGMDNAPGRRIAARVVEEAANVAAASGIGLDRARILATIDAALREHAHHKASMLQDRELGRRPRSRRSTARSRGRARGWACRRRCATRSPISCGSSSWRRPATND